MAATKYLDYDGLLYFWQKLKTKFPSENTTYTLTQDSQDGHKITLTPSSGSATTITIPDNNTTYTLTQDGTDGHKITFTPSSGSATTITIPDNNTEYTGSTPISVNSSTHVISHDTSGVTAASKGDATAQTPGFGGTFKAISGTVNATGHLTAFAEHTVTIPNATATAEAAGLMSTDDKTKLTNIASGAQVNVIETVQVNGTALSVSSKTVNVPVMTGASANAAGAVGVVPAPAAGDEGKYLRGDGSWVSNTVTVDSALSSSSENPVQNKVINSALNGKAPTANPTFTGTVTIPTATAGTNDTTAASTAFVNSAISTAQVGAATFKGTVNTGTDISGLSDYKKGWYWVVATAGTYVGETCEVGDMIFAIADFNSAYSASDFSVLQTNLNITSISNAEIDTILAS